MNAQGIDDLLQTALAEANRQMDEAKLETADGSCNTQPATRPAHVQETADGNSSSNTQLAAQPAQMQATADGNGSRPDAQSSKSANESAAAAEPTAQQQAEAMKIYQQALEQYNMMAIAAAQAAAQTQAPVLAARHLQTAQMVQVVQQQAVLAAQQAQAAGAASANPPVAVQQVQAAQVVHRQAMLAGQQSQQPAQATAPAVPSNLGWATTQQGQPGQAPTVVPQKRSFDTLQQATVEQAQVPKGKGKVKGKIDLMQQSNVDPHKTIDNGEVYVGVITKVDDSGDFGFCKLKNQVGHVFIHKQHYTNRNSDHVLEVGAMIQCKLYAKEPGKHSCSQAHEILDAEATQKLKQEMDLEFLDDTIYTGWVVWLDLPNAKGKIRSDMLEKIHPHLKQDVTRGVFVLRQRTQGLALRMMVNFQLELNQQDQLLGRNIFIVPGASPDECPFSIADPDGYYLYADDDESKGKGKDVRGMGTIKGKGGALPPGHQSSGPQLQGPQPVGKVGSWQPPPISSGLMKVATDKGKVGDAAKVEGEDEWNDDPSYGKYSMHPSRVTATHSLSSNSWNASLDRFWGNSWDDSWDDSWENSGNAGSNSEDISWDAYHNSFMSLCSTFQAFMQQRQTQGQGWQGKGQGQTQGFKGKGRPLPPGRVQETQGGPLPPGQLPKPGQVRGSVAKTKTENRQATDVFNALAEGSWGGTPVTSSPKQAMQSSSIGSEPLIK